MLYEITEEEYKIVLINRQQHKDYLEYQIELKTWTHEQLEEKYGSY